MGLRAAVVMASCDGACKTCPYDKECDENPNANHPFDAYCELWSRKARRIRGYEDKAREHCRDYHGDCGVCPYDKQCPYDARDKARGVNPRRRSGNAASKNAEPVAAD